MTDETTWFWSEPEESRFRFAAIGGWTTTNADRIERATRRVAVPQQSIAVLDLGEIDVLDTTGALLLHRIRDGWEAAGVRTTFTNVPVRYREIVDRVGRIEEHPAPQSESRGVLVESLVRLGRGTVDALRDGRALVAFLGLTVITGAHTIVRPQRLRFASVVSHMESAGFRALPIVGLLAFLIGVVLAYQSADQLARFGAQIFTVNLLAISMLREVGIVLTAIVVAGRSGSAFTAQIGTMKVREEVDAMETLGMNPIEVLVLPRIIALVLVLPLLGFYADVMGLLGGAIMALIVLQISFAEFISQLESAITPWTFWIGIIKAPFFAFIIALVGCFQGLRVEGDAESVGRLTTDSVVVSIFLVIVMDAIFSILFSTLGI